MKIGQFTDTLLPVVDGVGRVVSNYAQAMGRLCEACYVIAPQQKNLYQGSLPYEIVDFSGIPLPKLQQYRAGLPALDAHYLSRIAQVQLDIAHAHSPFIAGREAYRISRRQGIPLVGTFHSKYYDDFYQYSHSSMLSSMGNRLVIDFFFKMRPSMGRQQFNRRGTAQVWVYRPCRGCGKRHRPQGAGYTGRADG